MAARGKGRTRARRVWAVSIAVEETATHWLVSAEPQLRGVYGHRAKLPKCGCVVWSAQAVGARAGRCSCKGWNVYGVALYVRQLLRSYPKVTVRERVAG